MADLVLPICHRTSTFTPLLCAFVCAHGVLWVSLSEVTAAIVAAWQTLTELGQHNAAHIECMQRCFVPAVSFRGVSQAFMLSAG